MTIAIDGALSPISSGMEYHPSALNVRSRIMMRDSHLQEPFVRDVAISFAATKNRILRRIAEAPFQASSIVEEELRGLYHGFSSYLLAVPCWPTKD